MDALVRFALDPPAVTTTDDLDRWWSETFDLRAAFATPFDRAVAGGALADRIGFAFAAGYREALRELVPSAPNATALCATEADGNHPRAIKTSLVQYDHGAYFLSGSKTWATVGSDALDELLVVARRGEDIDGRPNLALVRVAAHQPNVAITRVASPFVPEIRHASIEFRDAEVAAILPGDGYDDYLKPFRTIEDLHVHGALLGYLVALARRHDWPLEQLLVLTHATRSIALAPAKSEATHLALAGLFALIGPAIADLETRWAAIPDDEFARWKRDRPLLNVAMKARIARHQRALRELGSARTQ